MRELIDQILAGDFTAASEKFEEAMDELVDVNLDYIKEHMAKDMFEKVEQVDEGNIQRMGRAKLIKVRIRSGKVQRRVKRSAIPGYTFRDGHMIRMSAQERRHRKLAARMSKFKRRAKMRQAIRKRKMSLRRRHTMGL